MASGTVAPGRTPSGSPQTSQASISRLLSAARSRATLAAMKPAPSDARCWRPRRSPGRSRRRARAARPPRRRGSRRAARPPERRRCPEVGPHAGRQLGDRAAAIGRGVVLADPVILEIARSEVGGEADAEARRDAVLAERGARQQGVVAADADEAALGRAGHEERRGSRERMRSRIRGKLRHSTSGRRRRRGDAERAHEEGMEDEAGDRGDEARRARRAGRRGARPDPPDRRPGSGSRSTGAPPGSWAESWAESWRSHDGHRAELTGDGRGSQVGLVLRRATRSSGLLPSLLLIVGSAPWRISMATCCGALSFLSTRCSAVTPFEFWKFTSAP